MQKSEYQYDVVFVTTFIDEKNISNLIESVLNNKYISILFILINQTDSIIKYSNNDLIEFFEIKTNRVSLSNARNVALKFLIHKNVNFNHLMFPDDDTTFPESFFQNFHKVVFENGNYLVDVYCKDENVLFKSNSLTTNTKLDKSDFELAMSVNMIISFSTFSATGLFDEKLGVGAQYGAGEDGDYFIRSSSVKEFKYIKELFNFHPSNRKKSQQMTLSKVVTKYVNYGNGVIYMLCKHKMYFRAFKVTLYAAGGAINSLLRLNIKLFIAYFIAYFSRSFMFLQCVLFLK